MDNDEIDDPTIDQPEPYQILLTNDVFDDFEIIKRVCTECHIEKDITYFYKKDSGKRYFTKCKECVSIQTSNRNATNRGKSKQEIKNKSDEQRKLEQKFYYDEIKQIIENRGGKIISTSDDYKNMYSEITYKCHNNHKITGKVVNIKQGSWCIDCCSKLGERICKYTLECLLGYPIKHVRPNFLRNPETGCCLELDAYCEELNVAVEYNGSQHYHMKDAFHKNEQDLVNQIERDKLKVKLCKDNNVDLIIVSYKIKNDDIFEFILNELIKLNYSIPKENIKKFDISQIYKTAINKEKHEELVKFIHDNGGKLIDGVYCSFYNIITLKCKKGHILKMTIRNVIRGNLWCKHCNLIERHEARQKIIDDIIKNGKICNGELCNGILKSYTEFYHIESNHDSFRTICKKCYNERYKDKNK
jgi:hypothetical protein